MVVTLRFAGLIFCCIIVGSQAAFCPPNANIEPCFCSEIGLHISCSERSDNSTPWDIKATFDYISTIVPEGFVFGDLSLRNTKLKEIPAGTIQHVKFEKIIIDSSEYLEFIHPDAFNGTLDTTVELQITSNPMLSDSGPNRTDDDIFNVIRKFKNLTKLDFYANNLTFLPSRVFEGLSELTHLAIRVETFNTIGSQIFAGLPKLLSGSVRYAGISLYNIAEDAFVGVGPDAEIDVTRNQFSRLPENIFKPLLDNARRVLVGGTDCSGWSCFNLEMDCDEVSAWICKDVEKYQSKLDGFYCRFWSRFVDIFDYCLSHNNYESF